MNKRELAAEPFWIDIASGVSQGIRAKFSMCFHIQGGTSKFFVWF
jgi:hypothetical protein